MGTAGRTGPLRRSGALLGLLGVELAAVLALHWLGRFGGLRIRWDEPVPWLLSSPVQEVLGAMLRTVGLVMAYWLLASTVLYLLASLSRLPSAVRAVRWATFPLVRRVADHAVAVTLATSMVGGGTLGVAGPALASDSRAGLGPPGRKPVAAAQPTDSSESSPSYEPTVPEEGSTSSTEETTTSSTTTSTTAPEPAPPANPSYVPAPGEGQGPLTTTTTTAPPTTTTTTTTTPTTTTTTTTPPMTTTTAPPTTTTTTTPSTTPTTAEATTSSGSTTSSSSTTSSTSTTGPRPPAYEPTPGTPAPEPRGEPGPDEPGAGEGAPTPGAGRETHRVATGESLWTIAEDHLAETASGGAGEPTTDQVTAYWERVKDVNQNRLQSGDPNLIEPGETIALPPVPSPPAGPAPKPGRGATHRVATGDSLWTIAEVHLARTTGGGAGEPTTDQVTAYWERVKEANRGRLRSGDPDLIEPGETIVLPPVE